jgi:hypothetical protein
MKNPNTPFERLKTFLHARWWSADFPGGEERFQVVFLARDLGTFLALPIFAAVLSRAVESGRGGRVVTIHRSSSDRGSLEAPKSQVIEFARSGSGKGGPARRAPGTLVRVRLLNSVETLSATPVHVQILDLALGKEFLGGTLLGDGAGDNGLERINIGFHFARDPKREGVAYPITARALSLDGTLGIEAEKKEGLFARATYGAGTSSSREAGTAANAFDLRSILLQALSAGLAEEFGAESQVERNRAEVLTLQPGAEFFAELTDYFPGAGK